MAIARIGYSDIEPKEESSDKRLVKQTRIRSGEQRKIEQ